MLCGMDIAAPADQILQLFVRIRTIISHLFFSISKAIIPKLRMWSSDSGTTRIKMTNCQNLSKHVASSSLEGHKKEPPRFAKLQVDLRKALVD